VYYLFHKNFRLISFNISYSILTRDVTSIFESHIRYCARLLRLRQKITQWSRSADSTVAERICERSLLLDDLEVYTNSSERSRIRSATVESAERTEI